MTKYYADYYGIAEYTMIGNHAFFYRWVVNKKTEVEETSDEDVESGENVASSGKTKESEKEKEEKEKEEKEKEENAESAATAQTTEAELPEFTQEELDLIEQYLESQKSGEGEQPTETPTGE